MRIIVDTNVIMDILLKREPFFQASYGALKAAAEQNVECLVSASAVTDIFYLLRRGLKDNIMATQALERLLQIVNVADVLEMDIRTALSSHMKDFEDAVVHAVAARNDAELILTRNVKDFTEATVKVLTPKEFLEQYPS